MNENLTRKLTTLIIAQGMAAVAQDAPTNSAPATAEAPAAQLPDVIVKGERDAYKPEAVQSPKFTEPLRDIPQSITVVPRAVMEQQGVTSLRDALRNVPGISMQAGEGGVPAGDNFSIRGFSARTDIFVDNFRDFGGYSRDVFNLEQIEVFKGPTSVTTGRGSTGGSVNMASKAPLASPYYSGTLGGGTDEYKRATLDVNQPLGEIGLSNSAVRLNALWYDADTPGRDHVDQSRWGVAPAVTFGLGTPTRLSLYYFHLSQHNRPDYGIPWVPATTNVINNSTFNAQTLSNYGLGPEHVNHAPPVDFNNFYGLKSDYEKTYANIATARIEHDFTDSLWIRDSVRWGQATRDSVTTAPRFISGTNTTAANAINRQLQSRDMTDTLIGNALDLTANFDTWKIDHTVVGGTDFNYETSVNYGRSVFVGGAPITGGNTPTAPAADLYNPNPNFDRFGPVRRNGAKSDATATSVGVYAFDTMKLGEKWEAVGGLRWDYFDVDTDSLAIGGIAPLAVDRTDDDLISWRGGLVYKPLPNGSVYFGVGSSFNPSAEGLTLTTNLSLVAPEQTRAYEIGTKWDLLDKRLFLTAALFRTEKFNARTTDQVTGEVTVTGEQVVQGFEVGFAGRITDLWQVNGGYTYMASEIIESKVPGEAGSPISNTPKNSFSLWTVYQLPLGFELGGGLQYLDARRNTTAPPNTRIAPAYYVFDAMLAYNINENITIRLNVYNLADNDYIDRVGGGHFIPGQGRSAVLSASFSF